jgi:hypothetical protein
MFQSSARHFIAFGAGDALFSDFLWTVPLDESTVFVSNSAASAM